MDVINSIPIDWANVNWLYVVVLAVFVFVASLLGSVLSFNRRGFGALLTALLFAAAFVFWTYYPHGLPLPTSLAQKPAAHTAPRPAACRLRSRRQSLPTRSPTSPRQPERRDSLRRGLYAGPKVHVNLFQPGVE